MGRVSKSVREYDFPNLEQVKKELKREQYRTRYRAVLRSTVNVMIVVAAVAVLAATLWIPVLQIYGTSMSPTLDEGEIVISVKDSEFEAGDLVAFYIGNKLLIKRSIAGPGQWVDIDKDGNIYVDKVLLDEPYIAEKSLGDCNIQLPYQVPEDRYFLLGDHRATSVDSRNTAVGCIAEEQIVGKVVYRVWPLNKIGLLD